MLIIIDRGFQNKYFLKTILNHKRNFLIRIGADMMLLMDDIFQLQKDNQKKKGRKKKFPGKITAKISKQIKKTKGIIRKETQKGTLWIIPNIIIKAWSDQIKTEGSVIVFHQNGFKNPIVLYSSESDVDIQKGLELINYYFKRWKIELIFKEEKQLFNLEGFKVTTIKALYRYIHLVMLAYTILFIKKIMLQFNDMLRKFIEFYLRKKRNIKRISLHSLKIFYEKCKLHSFDFSSTFALFLEEKMGFAL